jgi:hypothetical protein
MQDLKERYYTKLAHQEQVDLNVVYNSEQRPATKPITAAICAVELAIEVSAEREVGFAVWCAKSYLYQNNDKWYKIQDSSNKLFTTSELYTQYLETQK